MTALNEILLDKTSALQADVTTAKAQLVEADGAVHAASAGTLRVG